MRSHIRLIRLESYLISPKRGREPRGRGGGGGLVSKCDLSRIKHRASRSEKASKRARRKTKWSCTNIYVEWFFGFGSWFGATWSRRFGEPKNRLLVARTNINKTRMCSIYAHIRLASHKIRHQCTYSILKHLLLYCCFYIMYRFYVGRKCEHSYARAMDWHHECNSTRLMRQHQSRGPHFNFRKM